jgi:D-glycero-D-manno-heptose 1,7-bisphosphate phosphatase
MNEAPGETSLIAKRRAVFLDRDGVLNQAVVVEGKPFPPANLGEMVILAGAQAACSALSNAGFLLIMVTNQPDIARKRANSDQVAQICAALKTELGLDDIRICPHDDSDNCDCRKPKPGLFLDAALEWNIDLATSYMVGDRWRDIVAGDAAGCTSIFIDYNYQEPQPEKVAYRCGSLIQACEFILGNEPIPQGDTNVEVRR